MGSIDTDISNELKLEGGLVHDPADAGGVTNSGISQVANPDVTVTNLTEQQTRDLYLKRYVQAPGFDKITDTKLQAQLIDFGVNSGPAVAVMRLQEILHVEVDGLLGQATLTALAGLHPDDVNTALCVARVKMLGRIVVKNPSQLKFLNGWLDRATQFIL